ncbi:MAG: single-stranded-DNA-specific exonuclease RecJ [Woeseia sp.]|nr:single-stranded-DNA-specific exonuclease RecJ [Woeseia sp.]NNE61294.1 single-stranded-DNA-specific exonuclease RecJ [Woeseia sp.]
MDARLPDASAVAALAGLHPVLARIYASRGVRGEDDLDYSLAKLAPVGSLQGVDEAVDLLYAHRDEPVIVIGDFDADGATSTALVLRCLREFGFRSVDYLVPNRFAFGYGLTPEIVDVAAERGPALLVTVDNGVSSINGVARANALGIKVLVTDHHLPGSALPEAAAMVNPNLRGGSFASPNLAGVGVAFYVMAALGRRFEEQGVCGAARVPARFLDLVALGTVADVVPLDRNNRILVRQGLDRVRAGHGVSGITALLRIAGRDFSRVCSADFGFAVGPRLNAAGRLEDMSVGIECLLTDDPAEAERLAQLLDGINNERRAIESDMQDQAFAFVDAMDARNLPPCVTVYDPGWHQGVVGLVAARVRERCHRPVVAFAREKAGVLKGSARSVPGVHIRDLLEAVSTANPGLIEKFGGHAMAAGLSLAEERLGAFRKEVARQLLRLYPDADFREALHTDGALPVDSFTLDFARSLRNAGPWGAGFPEPLFHGAFAVHEQRTVGERHLKMRVAAAAGGPTLDAIAFNQSGAVIRGVVELAFKLDVNSYRGVESPQLIVEQITTLRDTVPSA